MSRRHRAERREIIPDAKFGDLVLAKFMNTLMYDGKKSAAEGIIYGAFDTIQPRPSRIRWWFSTKRCAMFRRRWKCVPAASAAPPTRCRSKCAPTAARAGHPLADHRRARPQRDRP